MVDDNNSTGWAETDNTLPPIIQIELKKPSRINGSRIVWGKDSDWYTYRIEGSTDKKNWQVLKPSEKVSGQDYKTNILGGTTIKYVRIYLRQVQPETSKAAIKEIQLYEDKK